MDFIRNKEIKRELWAYLVLNVVFFIIAYDGGESYRKLMVGATFLFTFLHFFSAYLRYKKISGLCYDIDCILHGKDRIEIHKYREGELAILQNEVGKMTLRLKEQAEVLKRDKTYLSDSIADISHQLKTPLTSIRLMITLLGKADLTHERRRELVKDMDGFVSRIDWLISTLLKISRLDAGTVEFKKAPIDVGELVNKAVEPIAITMDLKSQNLQMKIPPGTKFLGDFSWSVEAFGNIVKNSMEHTPEGGKLWVLAKENPIYTEIIVEDNGGGIDPEDLPHLFQRFYKGKNSSRHSVGIGLALAQKILVRQNGTIKAENTTEGGARFIIRFYKCTV